MKTLSVHEIPEITLLYVPCVVTRDTMPREVPPLLDRLTAAVASAGLKPQGNAMLVYRGGGDYGDDGFALWVGLPMPAGTQAFGDFSVARLPGFRCATRVHVGPTDNVGEAYGDLLQHIHDANLEPTPEIREEYLHHEPAHPDNDVTWLQIGVRQTTILSQP